MKTDGSLATLIQGVSQQPASRRLPGQCALQENFSSNPVDGLTRRPPLEFVSHLFTSAENPEFRDIALGSTSKYVMAVFNGDLRVWNLDGTEQTVNIPTPTDTAYLDGSKLAFTTIDYDTYIANKSKVTALTAGHKSFLTHGSLISLLGGQYGKTYTITVTWVVTGVTKTATSSFSTPDGSVAAHILQVASTYIATQLTTALNANVTNSFNTLFTCTRADDVILIDWKNPATSTNFSVTVADGEAETIMVPCNNSVGDISKLPRFAPQGYHVRIEGSAGSGADDWYLQFECDPDTAGAIPAVGAGFGKAGSWKECVAADVDYRFDTTTMPHKITFDPDVSEFTYSSVPFKDRRVGDDTTNPEPSFVGKALYDLAYFQGRLTMTAGNAVIMSRTNKPDDFWVETATAQTDTDPIDIESSVDGVSQMEKLVPHNRDLVVFSPAAQFIVFGRNTLTPKNSSLVLTTTFEAALSASPVPAGKNVFFSITYGKYVGIREFFTEGSADINDARPITSHVLKYIKGNVRFMAASSNFDMLLVNTDTPVNALYTYEYVWMNDKKAQSSWSTWFMPDEIKYYWYVDSVVYLIMKRNEDFLLCKMDLDMQDDTDVGYQVKLDYKAIDDGISTIVTPTVTYDPDQYVVVQGTDCPNPGTRVLVKSVNVDGDELELEDDMLGGTVIHGIRYSSRYIPTLPTVKDSDGIKVGTSNLRVGRLLVTVSKSGKMFAKKFSKFAADAVMYFSGRFVGNPNTVVGEEVNTDNVFIVPFRDKPENADLEIYTTDHTPLTVQSIEWVGQYNKKGRRITNGG